MIADVAGMTRKRGIHFIWSPFESPAQFQPSDLCHCLPPISLIRQSVPLALKLQMKIADVGATDSDDIEGLVRSPGLTVLHEDMKVSVLFVSWRLV